MATILFQLIGLFVFLLTSSICGKMIRKETDFKLIQKPIRILHLFFWVFLIFPAWAEFIYPGYSHLDSVLGLNPLPGGIVLLILGGIIFLVGCFYASASIWLISHKGSGAMAFKFSKRVVINGVYDQLRNPMALGYYLMLLGGGLIFHSTYFTFFNLIVVIPTHIFFIKYCEEYEVDLRLGASYKEYKQNTPFLIPNIFNKRTL